MNYQSCGSMSFLSIAARRLLGIVLLIAFWIAPPTYAQPSSQVSLPISNGKASIKGAKRQSFHPGHTLVRFRPGAAAVFPPGSRAVPVPGVPGLFMVNNAASTSVDDSLKAHRA